MPGPADISPRKKSNKKDTTICFTDGHYGSQTFNLARDWGDIIIRRSDGVFAYQLAVTADDALMGVTQVVRGCDLLSSSVPQIFLFRTFGYEPPCYLHLPLLITGEGARLAKRDKAADLGFLRQQCPDPEPLIGYIAWLLGQLPKPEPVTADDLLSFFDAKKFPDMTSSFRETIGKNYNRFPFARKKQGVITERQAAQHGHSAHSVPQPPPSPSGEPG